MEITKKHIYQFLETASLEMVGDNTYIATFGEFKLEVVGLVDARSGEWYFKGTVSQSGVEARLSPSIAEYLYDEVSERLESTDEDQVIQNFIIYTGFDLRTGYKKLVYGTR